MTRSSSEREGGAYAISPMCVTLGIYGSQVLGCGRCRKKPEGKQHDRAPAVDARHSPRADVAHYELFWITGAILVPFLDAMMERVFPTPRVPTN
jgi:hypothetical protein